MPQQNDRMTIQSDGNPPQSARIVSNQQQPQLSARPPTYQQSSTASVSRRSNNTGQPPHPFTGNSAAATYPHDSNQYLTGNFGIGVGP